MQNAVLRDVREMQVREGADSDMNPGQIRALRGSRKHE